MIRTLPEWYGEAESILDEAVVKITTKNNIKFSLMLDSKKIEKAKSDILMSLVNIKENAYPDMDEKYFKEFKKLNKLEKKSKNIKK